MQKKHCSKLGYQLFLASSALSSVSVSTVYTGVTATQKLMTSGTLFEKRILVPEYSIDPMFRHRPRHQECNQCLSQP